MFEQPAPYTYPIFRPEGPAELRRIDPLVTSAAQQRALLADRRSAASWSSQLAAEDSFHGFPTFGLPVLDHSPFFRLVRRSVATDYVETRKAAVLDPASRHHFPWDEVLRRMVMQFAEIARQDGQVPVVFLIQTSDPRDPDLRAHLVPTLATQDIPYLATADTVDPSDTTAYVGDGHFTPENDRTFAVRFLELYDEVTGRPGG